MIFRHTPIAFISGGGSDQGLDDRPPELVSLSQQVETVIAVPQVELAVGSHKGGVEVHIGDALPLTDRSDLSIGRSYFGHVHLMTGEEADLV